MRLGNKVNKIYNIIQMEVREKIKIQVYCLKKF